MLHLFAPSKKTRLFFFAYMLFGMPTSCVDTPDMLKMPETLGEGLLMGFGDCPERFKYSAQIWNDLPVPLAASLRPSTNFMGANSELIAQMYGTVFKFSHTPALNYQELVAPYSIEAFDKSDQPANLLNKHLCHGKLIVDLSAPKDSFIKGAGGTLTPGALSYAGIIAGAAHAGFAAGGLFSGVSAAAVGGAAGGAFMGFSMAMGALTFLAPFEGLMGGSHFYTYPFDVLESDKDTVHHFHTYALHGEPHCENVGNDDLEGGPYVETPAFDGVFFNHATTETNLTFKKLSGIHEKSYNPGDTDSVGADGTYTITLERESFNLLSADKDEPEAIRSEHELRSFDFRVGSKTIQIPTGTLVKAESAKTLVPKFGLGQEYTIKDPKKSNTEEKRVDPLTYTYEVTGNADNFFAGVQGFGYGNYNPIGAPSEVVAPSNATIEQLTKRAQNRTTLEGYIKEIQQDPVKIRDINPIDCFIWYQSIDQYNAPSIKNKSAKQPSAEATLNTHEQIWAVYKTRDSSIEKKLTAGQVTAFSIIRPQVAEGPAYLYIFAIEADTDDQAKKFLSYATDPQQGLPGSMVPTEDASTTNTAISSLQKITHDFLTDTHNTTGYLLLTDIFLPYGGGYSSPRWYGLPPLIHEIDNEGLVDSIASLCLDDTKKSEDRSKDFSQKYADVAQKLSGWFDEFNTHKKSIDISTITALTANMPSAISKLKELIPSLTQYLLTYGNRLLFVDQATGPGREFSSIGINQLYQILLGPIGFSNPLIRRQAGSNEYLWGTINWPEDTIWGDLKKMPKELKQFKKEASK